jgi:hypothetical protein
MPVAYAYNPSYLGGWDRENWSSRPAQANSQDPHLQNNQSKWTEGVGSSGRVPTLKSLEPWVQTPIPPKRKKERKKEGRKEGKTYQI